MRFDSRDSTQNRVIQTVRKLDDQTDGQKVHPDKHDPGNVLYKKSGYRENYLSENYIKSCREVHKRVLLGHSIWGSQDGSMPRHMDDRDQG